LIGREQDALSAQYVRGQAITTSSSKTSQMHASDIHAHWQDWAVRYGTDLRATTIASSIKRLEIAALHRAIERAVLPRSGASILEIGCGNGQNLVALAKIFADQSYDWVGIDYVPEMIEAANRNVDDAGLSDRVRLLVGDVLALDRLTGVDDRQYDVVFTDRLIINLDTIDKQISAIDGLSRHVRKGGALIMIENSHQTKDAQNDLREALGLPRRRDADFNLFLDDQVIVPHLRSVFGSVEIEDFGSLHDIVLYALLPHAMGSEFHYEHPIMKSIADLCSRIPIPCGSYGQNRLYFCRR
jgi:ubiquinone/menaquinone biosynthesis C-methylase UbiE